MSSLYVCMTKKMIDSHIIVVIKQSAPYNTLKNGSFGYFINIIKTNIMHHDGNNIEYIGITSYYTIDTTINRHILIPLFIKSRI